jgi:hypothetical protein
LPFESQDTRGEDTPTPNITGVSQTIRGGKAGKIMSHCDKNIVPIMDKMTQVIIFCFRMYPP